MAKNAKEGKTSKTAKKSVSGSQPFQFTKKNLVKAKVDAKKSASKAQEAKREAKNKNTKKHINARANFVLNADLDRISIKKKLQKIDQQRALERTTEGTQEDSETKENEEKPAAKENPSVPTKPAVVAETKSTKAAPGAKTEVPAYYKSGKTLIVGDGDFSFTASLLQYRAADPQNITSTTYDTINQVKNKYRNTYAKHLDTIHLGPAIILNDIDATRLDLSFPNPFTTTQFPAGTAQTPLQSVIKIQYPFDRILFNFPHSGEQRVHINRKLLADFFVSARSHLALPTELAYPIGSSPTAVAQRKVVDQLLEDVTGKLLPQIINVRKKYTPLAHQNGLHTDPFGRVLMVLRDGDPYDGWEVEVQAANGLYQLESKILWEPAWWKHYQHKTTDVKHNALEEGKAHVYVFKLTNIGVAMALKEIQKDIYPLQDQRNQEYSRNLEGKGGDCMFFTNDNSTPTDPTKIDSKLHLSPWQNRAIVKAQNRIKQQFEKEQRVSAGTTHPSDGKKRKAGALDQTGDGEAGNGENVATVLSAEQREEMANRFKSFTEMTDAPVPAVAAPTTKKSKKAQAAAAAAALEAHVTQPAKKQKIDLAMTGLTNAEKSKHLLDQLVQLDPIEPTEPAKAAKESKKKKDQKKTEAEPTEPSLFGSFVLDDLLALEASVAPNVTKQRIDADLQHEAAKKARQAEEEELAQKKLEQQKAVEAKKAAAAEEKAAKAAVAETKKKTETKPATSDGPTSFKSKNGKWDFSKSDDMDLSREIFAMLSGSRPEAVDTDDGEDDFGSSDGEDDMGMDSDGGDDADIPRSTFGLAKAAGAAAPKGKVTKSTKAPEPKKQTTVAAKAPVAAFAGFGTGGIGTKAKKQPEAVSKGSAATSKVTAKASTTKVSKKA